MEAKTSSPPGAPGLHWVVSGLDTAAVRVEDAALKKEIEDWLARNRQADHDWLLDINTPWTLPQTLFDELKSFDFQRATTAFLTRPTSTDLQRNVEFRIRFRRKPAVGPPPPLVRIGIELSTEDADSGGTRIDLGQIAPGVAARGVVKGSEAAPPETLKVVTAALRDVATRAWDISRERGVVIGSAATVERFAPVEQAIDAEYRPEGNGISAGDAPETSRPQPRAAFREDDPRGKGLWTLFVRRVRIVRDVTIEVPLVAIDDKHGSKADIDERRANAEQLKANTEAAAREHLAPQLDSLRNRVPTNAQLHSILKAAEADSALRPPATVRFQGSDILITARDAAPRYGFALSAEAGWSAEQRLYGTSTFSGDNLMRLSKGRRVESESTALSGLQEGWRGSGQWTLVTTRAGARGSEWKTGFTIASLLSYDRNQLFGNPAPTRLSFQSRNVSPAYTVEYSSPTRDANNTIRVLRFNWKFKGGPAVTFGRVVGEEGFSVTPPIESRSYGAIVTSNDLLLTANVRPPDTGGFGSVRAFLKIDSLHAPTGEDGFSRVGVRAEGSTTFGVSGSRDLLVRYQTGVDIASDATPLFELPRLGGTARLRGMEDGEQVGRRVGYAQLTFGPSLSHVVSWFGKKAPADKRLGPFRLSDVYIVGFFDRGVFSDDAPLSRLLWPNDAVGYGGAAELHNLVVGSMRATLTIGYGRSPDSNRHSKGITVVAVVLDLN